MTDNALEVQPKKATMIELMADTHHLAPASFVAAIRATVFKDGTNEQLFAFLMVAQKYELDPILKEIYAFPTQGGGILPIVSIDGWYAIANKHPQFDGAEFVENFTAAGELYSITAKIYRKDRSRPTSVTEYLKECKRDTMPWNKWPVRMLRHKAFIQCARVAFSLSGVYDPDEAARIEPSLGPVIEATEEGAFEVSTLESEKIEGLLKELFEKSDKTEAQIARTIRKWEANYAGNAAGFIEWLTGEVAKKQNNGGKKEPSVPDPQMKNGSTGTAAPSPSTQAPASSEMAPEQENLDAEPPAKQDPKPSAAPPSKPAPVEVEEW
jgi:phage recombination protein Bet